MILVARDKEKLQQIQKELKTDVKIVVADLSQEDKIKDILIAYEDKYFKTKNGKGVAFTVPIKSLIGVLIYQFLADIEV